MKMSNDFTFGQPQEVRERLMNQNVETISHSDLVGALANAFKRIADLEREVRELQYPSDQTISRARQKAGAGN
jgi:hypothetical protein